MLIDRIVVEGNVHWGRERRLLVVAKVCDGKV